MLQRVLLGCFLANPETHYWIIALLTISGFPGLLCLRQLFSSGDVLVVIPEEERLLASSGQRLLHTL